MQWHSITHTAIEHNPLSCQEIEAVVLLLYGLEIDAFSGHRSQSITSQNPYVIAYDAGTLYVLLRYQWCCMNILHWALEQMKEASHMLSKNIGGYNWSPGVIHLQNHGIKLCWVQGSSLHVLANLALVSYGSFLPLSLFPSFPLSLFPSFPHGSPFFFGGLLFCFFFPYSVSFFLILVYYYFCFFLDSWVLFSDILFISLLHL